ncbi:MAG: 50S ribosome-binding GTPase [Nitrospirae bacterium]|nr:50S ribosome-binding GTPase [Nitrospirota bacterium]
MPANLPPEYFEAEKAFKEAQSPSEKISALEALIATVPKHKGTDKLRADLRRRLSKLKDEAIKRKKGGKGDLYSVEKEGAGQAVLVGFANSGKSSLLQALTNARPQIADYPMTTVMPLSGMMPFEDIQFQVVDLPPIGNPATDGWVSAIMRNADILLLVVDLTHDDKAEELIEELLRWKVIKGPEKTILIGNKKDIAEKHSEDLLRSKYNGIFPLAFVSTKTKEGLEKLKGMIFKASGIIRVYSKEPGKPPDLNVPFTVPEGTTVLELAEAIHKDFVNLRYACVWGSSRFQGQRVLKTFVLKDKDVVEFHV